ncbi:MAG: LamG domain-containing protein [Prevotella sp.]|nr:LamG domain-containing protein [Prevotella sp.]
MALQIWLPLNGNLNNYGLSDLKFSVYQSSTTSNGSGKIGSCYTNNSNSSGGVISDKKINLGTKHSMFCWVKMTDFYSASSLTGILGQHRYPTCQGMGITMKYSSSTTGYLSVNTGNGNGSRTYNTYCGSSTLSAGTWYHVGYTYNNGVIKLYVNGKLDGTHSYTSSTIEDYVQLFSWSFNSSSITNETLSAKMPSIKALRAAAGQPMNTLTKCSAISVQRVAVISHRPCRTSPTGAPQAIL